MITYSVGFVLIFLTFFLLHLHAYRKRAELELDEMEMILTNGRLRANVLSIAIGLLSIAISLFGGPQSAAIAGMVFGLMGPAHGLNGYIVSRGLSRIENRVSSEPRG